MHLQVEAITFPTPNTFQRKTKIQFSIIKVTHTLYIVTSIANNDILSIIIVIIEKLIIMIDSTSVKKKEPL